MMPAPRFTSAQARRLKQATTERATPRTRPAKATRPVPTEHDEQCRLVAMAAANVARVPELACLFAIPNGLRTSMRTAVKARAEGLMRGVPDLFLAAQQYSQTDKEMYCGLFIEMKRARGGVVSKEQAEWHERLRAQGYRVVVCKGADEAWAAICQYLGVTP